MVLSLFAAVLLGTFVYCLVHAMTFLSQAMLSGKSTQTKRASEWDQEREIERLSRVQSRESVVILQSGGNGALK